MKELNLPLDGTGIQIGIVACRFNDAITHQLLEGTFNRLKKLGVNDEDINLIWVAGAFEAPLAAKLFADYKKVDAVICLQTANERNGIHYGWSQRARHCIAYYELSIHQSGYRQPG